MTTAITQPLTPEEQVRAVADETKRLVAQIGDGLNRIHHETDRSKRFALARACWERVDDLNTLVNDSAYLVGMAAEMMEMMTEQRDEAVRALNEAVYLAEMNIQEQAQLDAVRKVASHLREYCNLDKEAARFWARLFVTGRDTYRFHEDALHQLGARMAALLQEVNRD